jgi:hypothetical protein
MTIQFFLAFVGTLVGSSIALALVVKKISEGFAVSGKKPYTYGFFSAVFTSLAAYLAVILSDDPFYVFWILGGVFLLFGIVYIGFVHNRYFFTYKTNSNKVLLAEIIFGLSVIIFTIAVFSSLQYFLKEKKDFLFYPLMMSALLFFVPLLFYHTFQAAFNIPASYFPTWQYPLHQPIELPDEDSREKIAVIGFEIAKKASDHRKTYFRAKGPETMKLGEFFYHFINEYNEHYSGTAIEYADGAYEPFEWWFHRKPKWYQTQKIYDPELSIRENGIWENTVIICERVHQPAHISNVIHQKV